VDPGELEVEVLDVPLELGSASVPVSMPSSTWSVCSIEAHCSSTLGGRSSPTIDAPTLAPDPPGENGALALRAKACSPHQQNHSTIRAPFGLPGASCQKLT
jgi:hypothetical protein